MFIPLQYHLWWQVGWFAMLERRGQTKGNHGNNDNNDNRIERRNLRLFTISSLRWDCLQHARSSGPGVTVCKSCATHRTLITCSMSCASIQPSPLQTEQGFSFNIIMFTIDMEKKTTLLGVGIPLGPSIFSRNQPRHL